MNKLGVVLGMAAVATLAGCKDPDYKYASATPTQNEVKAAAPTAPAEVAPAAPAATVATAAPVEKACKCLPGTKHSSPCACGAADCLCVVEVKPIAPAAPETTTYIVQSGDFLAKISKKFNVTISSIKALNGLKSDMVRVGQKLKLPGKIDVGVQSVPAAAKLAAPKAAKKSVAAYTGATKEYVVKSGDTLGAIAYGNGINIRQLKALNSLTKDALKVGQKLKVPANGAAAKSAKAEAKPEAKGAQVSVALAPAATPAAAPAAEATAAEAPAPAAEAAPTEATAAPAPAAAEATAPATIDYVVQDTDDMTGVSIRFGVSAAEIRELNNLGENDQLVPGKVLKLPAEAQQ